MKEATATDYYYHQTTWKTPQAVFWNFGGLPGRKATVHTDEIRFCWQFEVVQQLPNRDVGQRRNRARMARWSRLRHFISIQKQIAYKILSRESATEVLLPDNPP